MTRAFLLAGVLVVLAPVTATIRASAWTAPTYPSRTSATVTWIQPPTGARMTRSSFRSARRTTHRAPTCALTSKTVTFRRSRQSAHLRNERRLAALDDAGRAGQLPHLVAGE